MYPSALLIKQEPFRGFLRDRFTLRRLTERRKPSTGRRSCFSQDFSLLMSAFSLLISPGAIQLPFPDWQNVPLLTLEKAAFKVSSLRWITWALIHFRCHGARPVSYYAFFKGWLLPSPPPGCHRSITSFSTKWLLRDLSVRSGLFPSRLWILAPKKSVCTNDDGLYSEFPWGW